MATPNLSRAAMDYIRKMQPKYSKQVLIKIIELCGNPFPPDSKQLKGSSEGYHRVDSGEYRIIYRIDSNILEVYTIGKRNDDEVYRRFERR